MSADGATLRSILAARGARWDERGALDPRQRQVVSHVTSCRTAALGGRLMGCDDCGHDERQYHSCRDRHCPRCQRALSRAWCERQREAVLPVTYHHLVFTLPSELNGWVGLHPEVLYRIVFGATWTTLKGFGEDPKRLDGQLGMTAVLHTWGEALTRHVHLHCLVPGGALGKDGRWHAASETYLFPVRALSRKFRGHAVAALRAAATAGELDRVTRPGEVAAVLDALMAKDWVVYSAPCPGRAEAVVNYLGRYTHRIAISDERIVAASERQVRFRCKDYRRDGARRTMTLETDEFIRRYLLHVLPKGLMRVRHYGFLANRCRRRRLEQIRQALKPTGTTPATTAAADEPASKRDGPPERDEPWTACPRCRTGTLVARCRIAPRAARRRVRER